MTEQPTARHDQKQQHEALENQVADLLLAAESPVRGNDVFRQLLDEHDRLVKRQAELRELESKVVDVLPGVDQTEACVTHARQPLQAEEKALSGFAGEPGKAAFTSLQTGEPKEHPSFSGRNGLQSRIDVTMLPCCRCCFWPVSLFLSFWSTVSLKSFSKEQAGKKLIAPLNRQYRSTKRRRTEVRLKKHFQRISGCIRQMMQNKSSTRK